MEIVKDSLADGPLFLVSMKITPDNRIFIDIDGDNGVTIDDCINLSRTVENSLNRDEEDFELNVSSYGADSPLKMPRQYVRHIGRTLSVETNEGEKVEATLTATDENGITVKTRGSKRQPSEEFTFAYKDIRTAHVVIEF